MNKEKVFSLIRELLAPVALILLGAMLLFNPDSASALISKALGWFVIVSAGLVFNNKCLDLISFNDRTADRAAVQYFNAVVNK